MSEMLPTLQPPTLGMPLIRERVAARVPRGSRLDATINMLPEVPVPTTRRAAVAAILRDSSRGPELLFIRRAEHPNDPWSGHMAFPGGREEPGDTNLLATAVRETREEVALDLQRAGKLLGQLDELPAVARGRRTGLTISPFVFEVTGETALVQNYEVAEIVWAPLEPMFRGEHATTFPYEIAGQQMQFPAHNLEGRLVWGLTHRMLEGLFQLLR